MSAVWIIALLFLVGSLLLALTIGPIINHGNHRPPPIVAAGNDEDGAA